MSVLSVACTQSAEDSAGRGLAQLQKELASLTRDKELSTAHMSTLKTKVSHAFVMFHFAHAVV